MTLSSTTRKSLEWPWRGGFVVVATLTVGVIGCKPSPPTTVSGKAPAPPSRYEDALRWLNQPSASSGELQRLLTEGLSASDLRRACVTRASRLRSPRRSLLELWPWLALERELAPKERRAALLRAALHTQAIGGRAVSAQVIDHRSLLGLETQALIDGWRDALAHNKRLLARRHIRAIAIKSGREVVTDVMAQWAATRTPDAELTWATLDLLDRTDWTDMHEVLDAWCRSLTPALTDERQRRDRLLQRSSTLSGRETGLPPNPDVSVDLARAFKRRQALVDSVTSWGLKGAHVGSLWDGLAVVASLDPLRWIRKISSLRELSLRAPSPRTRWLLLFTAADALDRRKDLEATAAPAALTVTYARHDLSTLGDLATKPDHGMAAMDERRLRGERDAARALAVHRRLPSAEHIALLVAITRTAALAHVSLQPQLHTQLSVVGLSDRSPPWRPEEERRTRRRKGPSHGSP